MSGKPYSIEYRVVYRDPKFRLERMQLHNAESTARVEAQQLGETGCIEIRVERREVGAWEAVPDA